MSKVRKVFFLLILYTSSLSLFANSLERQFWLDYQKLLNKILVKMEFKYHDEPFIHSGVNYRRLYDNHAEELIDTQVNRLNAFNPENMEGNSKNTKLAFWINVYNFYTIVEIKRHYPISSMKKIGWDNKIVRINQNLLTLDQVEHEIIRPLKEPRIHFAINCASVSCPTLHSSIYESDLLEKQLDFVVRNALRNPLNLRIESGLFGIRMYATKLFSWFDEDFEEVGIINFIHTHSSDLYKKYNSYRSLSYDWDINTPENIQTTLDELINKLRH